jgi:hypothetical protein
VESISHFVIWDEAMNTTMYVFNKSNSKTFKGMTPIEAWTRKTSKSNHGV